MDRRRFLKYAGVTAALVGASALGLNYVSQQSRPTVSLTSSTTATRQVTTTTSPFTTSTQTVELASLNGRLFFDYNGNGRQDAEEPPVPRARITLKKANGVVVAEAISDSSGDYKLVDIRTGLYTLHVETEEKFQYMCRSSEEFRRITEGYELSLGYGASTPDMNIGLMEGFMTLPASRKTKFTWDRYWDWDPNRNRYLWWNGRSGSNLDNNYPNGYNHASIDYGMNQGQPILASAPGRVSWTTDFHSMNQVQSVFLEHNYGFLTSYDHLSKCLVKVGNAVVRGQKIAESGSTGSKGYAHLDSTLRTQHGAVTLDPFHPIFPIDEAHSGYYEIRATGVGGEWVSVPPDRNPAIPNYWTVYNKPQYASTES